jgi:hypothetical protein
MKTHEAITLKKHLSRLAEMDQKSPLDLSGAVRLKIAKTIRKCESAEADFEKVRIALVRAKGTADSDGNFNIERNTPAFAEFMAAIDEALAADAEGVPTTEFTDEDLKIEKNKIPIDVLNGLISVRALKD